MAMVSIRCTTASRHLAGVLRGFEKPLRINTGRRRLNINGVLNIHTQKNFFDFPESVNADSIMRLFESLDKHHRNAKNIYVIIDNARYNRSRKIQEYLKKHPRIKITNLPPYSPNLNLIERLWKYFKNRFYITNITLPTMNFSPHTRTFSQI